MTSTQNTQAVMQQALEALEEHDGNYVLGKEALARCLAATAALRAELARPLEVAPVTDAEVRHAFPFVEGWNHRERDLFSYRRALERFAASRVPVASVAEPAPKLAGSPFESYVAQVIHAAFADGWGSCRDSEFVGDEAMNDAFNQSATLGVCLSIDQRATPTPMPGGAGGGVTQPPTGDELALFRQTIEGFADCGETETDYAILLDWARRGLLECTNFRPTALAHRVLDAAEKGGAA